MPRIHDYMLVELEREISRTDNEYLQSRQSLVRDFKAVENDLATSEAEQKVRMGMEEQDVSSSLLNSEHSPYGCDETITSLGTKYWGYQPGSGPSLQEMVISHIPLPLKARFTRLLPWDNPQAVLDKLAELGIIHKDLLQIFRALKIETLDLSPSFRSPVNPSANKPAKVLKVFQMPHSFSDLQSLSLRKVPLKNEDVLRISCLNLVKLDLASTGITTEATAHLVALKDTLEELDLSNNPKMKHWACYNLASLTKLKTLALAGTQVRMLSLRYMCDIWKAPKVLDLTVPTQCRVELETLGERYHLTIMAPYISKYDEDRFSGLYSNQIRNNLAYHQQKDPSISLKGDSAIQLQRLKKHLKRREADLRLRAWVLKQPYGLSLVDENE